MDEAKQLDGSLDQSSYSTNVESIEHEYHIQAVCDFSSISLETNNNQPVCISRCFPNWEPTRLLTSSSDRVLGTQAEVVGIRLAVEDNNHDLDHPSIRIHWEYILTCLHVDPIILDSSRLLISGGDVDNLNVKDHVHNHIRTTVCIGKAESSIASSGRIRCSI